MHVCKRLVYPNSWGCSLSGGGLKNPAPSKSPKKNCEKPKKMNMIRFKVFQVLHIFNEMDKRLKISSNNNKT